MGLKKYEIAAALHFLGYRTSEIGRILGLKNPYYANTYLYNTRKKQVNMDLKKAMKILLRFLYEDFVKHFDYKLEQLWDYMLFAFNETFEDFRKLYEERKKWGTQKALITAYCHLIFTALLFGAVLETGKFRRLMEKRLILLAGKQLDLFYQNKEQLLPAFSKILVRASYPHIY